MKFNFWKRNEAKQSGSFILGVLDTFQLKNTDSLVVVGNVKGTVHIGDAVYISNPGSDTEKTVLTTVTSIENGPGKQVEEASDCHIGLIIEKGADIPVRKASVLYTSGISNDDVHKAYIAALCDVYVKNQNLVISDEEIENLSITDCSEIFRFFFWLHFQVENDDDEDTKQENNKKTDRLVAAMCKKILNTDEIYCLYYKDTGEPHMFSQTIEENGGYMCTPPCIRIFTKAYKETVKSTYHMDKLEIHSIVNGNNKDGIYNFLNSVFYLNGACGVEIISEATSIAASLFVPEPDYSKTEERNIPITNPSLMRWMLLIAQTGKPVSKEADINFELYYRFLSLEITKAKFLIPMKHNGETQESDENGLIFMKKGTEVQLAITDGKYGRPAVKMFTDWKRLRMVYGKEWGGLVQPISGMISDNDCVINLTQYPLAGFYVGKEMYGEMCKFSEDKKAN